MCVTDTNYGYMLLIIIRICVTSVRKISPQNTFRSFLGSLFIVKLRLGIVLTSAGRNSPRLFHVITQHTTAQRTIVQQSTPLYST
jgi:hypothetical protein